MKKDSKPTRAGVSGDDVPPEVLAEADALARELAPLLKALAKH